MRECVREELCLKAERTAPCVGGTALADERRLAEGVCRVELQPRLGRPAVEGEPCLRARDTCCLFEMGIGRGGRIAAQDPVVVVAAGHAELVIVRVDALTDAMWRGEVHRRARDGEDAPVGQGLGVRPRERIGEDLRRVLHDGGGGCAVKVKVGVVREVADGVCVAHGAVGEDERVVVGEAVGHGRLEVAGVAALALGADRRECHAIRDGLCRPEVVVQAVRSAVDVVLLVRARVLLELVGMPADRDAPVRDAVGVSSDDAAHRCRVAQVVRAAPIAEYDVDRRAVHLARKRDETCPIGGDGDGRSACVPQRIELDRLPVRHRTKR